jgi:hypothetical protein
MFAIQTRHATASTLALLALVTGCSTLNAITGPSHENLQRAYEQGDLAKLEETCRAGKERETRDVMRGSATEQEKEACKLADQLRGDNAKRDADEALAQFQGALTCDNAVSSLAAYGEGDPGEHDYAAAFASAGAELLECGNERALVEELSALARVEGAAPPMRMVREALEEGASTDASLASRMAKVAEANDFGFEQSWIAAAGITEWLIENSDYATCPSYVGALASPHVGTVKAFIEFHGLAKCGPASAAIAEHLGSENPEVRLLACEALGRIADPAHLEKLEVLAETDAAFEVLAGGAKRYYVRDACRAAAGKTKLAK